MIDAFLMMTKEDQRKAIYWDSDGQQLMVDNGSSASITPYLTESIVPPQPINSKVKGTGGHAQATYKGTVQWKVQDDQGQLHHFTLPNSYFIASAPSTIFCAQHLAQIAKYNYPLPLGTGEVMGDEYIQLFYHQIGSEEKHRDDPHCSGHPYISRFRPTTGDSNSLSLLL